MKKRGGLLGRTMRAGGKESAAGEGGGGSFWGTEQE